LKDCKLKGFSVKENQSGVQVFCFTTRHNGRRHEIRLTLEEIQKEFEKNKEGA
jgi:hypothetical protein